MKTHLACVMWILIQPQKQHTGTHTLDLIFKFFYLVPHWIIYPSAFRSYNCNSLRILEILNFPLLAVFYNISIIS